MLRNVATHLPNAGIRRSQPGLNWMQCEFPSASSSRKCRRGDALGQHGRQGFEIMALLEYPEQDRGTSQRAVDAQALGRQTVALEAQATHRPTQMPGEHKPDCAQTLRRNQCACSTSSLVEGLQDCFHFFRTCCQLSLVKGPPGGELPPGLERKLVSEHLPTVECALQLAQDQSVQAGSGEVQQGARCRFSTPVAQKVSE